MRVEAEVSGKPENVGSKEDRSYLHLFFNKQYNRIYLTVCSRQKETIGNVTYSLINVQCTSYIFAGQKSLLLWQITYSISVSLLTK